MIGTNRPPIIIIGMHRSGTSLLARTLESLGLFIGYRQDRNHEALFFRQINNWLLRQSGGSWDHPEPIHDLLQNGEVRALATDHIQRLVKSPQAIFYLGIWKYVRRSVAFSIDAAWGWKDPRNTFTLPIWLDIFPEAKIIHTYRHGVDVAKSLKTRQEITLETIKSSYPGATWRLISILSPYRRAFVHSARCLSLNGGLLLWHEYMKEAKAHLANLSDRSIAVSYEELLQNPSDILGTLACFCGLSCSEKQILDSWRDFKTGRAFAYRESPNLRRLAETYEKMLQSHGYEP